MKMIVGLGNPGNQYRQTRHNIGREIIEAFAKAEGLSGWKKEHYQAETLQCTILTLPTLLVLPLTYMNQSGDAVAHAAKSYSVAIQDIIIIHDDIDLPLAKIRISRNASSAGHRGVQSVIDALGSKDFCRVRIGIAPDRREKIEEVQDYVLEKFSPNELALIEQTSELVFQIIKTIILEGVSSAMNQYN